MVTVLIKHQLFRTTSTPSSESLPNYNHIQPIFCVDFDIAYELFLIQENQPCLGRDDECSISSHSPRIITTTRVSKGSNKVMTNFVAMVREQASKFSTSTEGTKQYHLPGQPQGLSCSTAKPPFRSFDKCTLTNGKRFLVNFQSFSQRSALQKHTTMDNSPNPTIGLSRVAIPSC